MLPDVVKANVALLVFLFDSLVADSNSSLRLFSPISRVNETDKYAFSL